MNSLDVVSLFGILTFSVTTLASILTIGFLLKVFYMRRQHLSMKIVTNTTILIILSMLSITGLIALSYTRYLGSKFAEVNEQSMYAITYMVYFALWIIANSYFLNKIARIPPDRIARFRFVRWVLNTEIFLLTILALGTSDIIPLFENIHLGLTRIELIEVTFVLLSQAALVTFVYFYFALARERENNASKLIKARIQLMQYAILMQIVLSLAITIAAVLLFAGKITDTVIEFGLFSTISVISIWTNSIVLSSINIPNRIRIRFNIAPKRFKFIIANNQ